MSAEDPMSAEDSAQSGSTDLNKQIKPRPRLRKLILWSAGLAILVSAVLIALPIAVAWYAEGWLKENGADAARIEDVDINLFTGVVRVTGLHASGGERERLELGSAEIGIRWWPLVSQRIYVEFLKLAEGHIDVVAADDGAWQIGALVIRPGEATPDEPAEIEVGAENASSWGFGSDVIALTGLQLTYRDQLFDTTVDVREVMLGSQFTWEAGRTTALKVDLNIDGSPLLLTSDLQPWAERRQFTGALKLRDLKLNDYQQVLQQMAGLADPRGTINFDLQMNVVYDADNTLELKVSGPLEVRAASFSLAGAAITNDSLGWDGEFRLKLPAPETGPLLRVAGALKLAGSDVRLEALELDTGLSSFGWSGNLALTPARSADASAEIAMQAGLTGTGFTLDHDRLPFLVAALTSFDAPSVEVDGVEQVSAQSMQLQGLRLIGHAEDAQSVSEVFSLGQLDLEGFDYDAQDGLTADTLTLRAPHASVVRNAQGGLEDVDAAIAVFTNTDEVAQDQSDDGQPAAAPESSVPLKISVGSVRILADDLLRFEDRSVTPTTTFRLTKTDLELTNVDISGDAPISVALTTGDGDMKFATQGTVNVFADTQSADLAIQLAALDLPQLSAYVPGYNIERGRLNADSKVVINGNALDVQNDLRIDRLSLSGKAAEGNDAVAQGLAMPIDVALDLLRDGDDRIKLQVPITGSLDNFSIGTGDIIRQATQKALQNAALSYVKTALQPLGTLLLVGNLAAKAARPRFEPVEMEAGDASLPAVGREYLQKLGSLLVERPGLRLTICGVATPDDRAALARIAEASAARQVPDAPDAVISPDSGESEPVVPEITDAQLLELAALRTSTVIDFLVDEQGVAKKRLFACRETIEASEQASPRAEISL